MPLWLELCPANDTDWRRLDEDEASLVAAEERARAMIVCKIVTPDGVRIVWEPGGDAPADHPVGVHELVAILRAGGQRG